MTQNEGSGDQRPHDPQQNPRQDPEEARQQPDEDTGPPPPPPAPGFGPAASHGQPPADSGARQDPVAPGNAGEGSGAHPPIAKAPEVTLPAFLKPVRRGHVLTILGGQLAAYAVLVVLGLLTIVGLLMTIAINDDGFTAGLGDFGLSGIAAYFTLPFQLAGTWLLGNFGLQISQEGQTQEVFSIWAPNFLVLIIAGAVAVWAARWVSRSANGGGLRDLPVLPRLVTVGGLSLVLSLLTLLLTWVLALRGSEEAPWGSGEVRILAHSAGADLFFGALLFYAVIGLLLTTPKRIGAGLRDRLNYFLPSASHATVVAFVHVVALAVPVILITLIAMTVEEGFLGVGTFLFWAPFVAIGSFVLGHSGALSAVASSAGFGEETLETETLWLWNAQLPWWVVLIVVLLTLAALALAALVWAVRRDARTGTLANVLSWITLPVVYLVLGFALMFFGQMSFATGFGGMGSVDASVAPAWWTFALLLLIGLVVEVLSRFVFQPIRHRIPPKLVSILGRRKK